MRIIYTDRDLRVGDEVVVYAPTANNGEPVKFCAKNDKWGLRPLASGVCAGDVPPLITPTHGGKTANVNRFYKRFVVA